MTTEQIEQAQVPALMAKTARVGRIIAATNATLESLDDDIERTAYAIDEWWLQANHAAVGAAGFQAVMQGAAWMLGKMYDTDPQPIYDKFDCMIGF